MEKEKLDYTLDIQEYDYLVIGTGLLESLYSAHLQKINKKKCLIIDQDTQYSSSIRTVNFKEFSEFINSINSSNSAERPQDKNIEQDNIQNQENQQQNQQEQTQKQKLCEQNDKQEDQSKQEEDEKIYDKGILKKSFKFEPVFISQELAYSNKDFENEMFENGKNLYRRFNIDLQPKVLFSTSLTVDMMRQADMDKYMDFKAIQAIYHFDNKKNKFILAPSSKGDIFKHKDLGLKEKKDMFNILHKCVKLFYIMTDFELDQNSIEEFDKDFQVDEETKAKFQQLKNEVCTTFMKSIGCSEKVMEIFMYTICNFEFNIIDWENSDYKDIIKKECTTQKFLGQVAKFIRSCGVHTKLPYLYTCYGTGDIPQGFSRISAVFGGQFILNPKIAVYDSQLKHFQNQSLVKQEDSDQNNTNKNFNYLEIDTNLINQQTNEQEDKAQQNKKKEPQNEQQPEIPNPNQKLIIKEGVIIGQEFRESYIKNILQKQTSELDIDENFLQQQTQQKQQLYLLRINMVAKMLVNDENQNQNEQQQYFPPIIMCIPPNNKDLQNKHPIHIFLFDSDTNTCHKDYVNFQVKTVISQEMAEANFQLKNSKNNQLTSFIDNMVLFIKNCKIFNNINGFEILHVGPYLQRRNAFNYGQTEQIDNVIQDKKISHQGNTVDRLFKFVLTDEENFELDMDRNFEEFRRNISKISEAFNPKEFNYFQTLKEQNGEEEYQNNDSDLEEDGLTKLINKFDDLKNKDVNAEKAEELEKEKNKEQIQDQENSNLQNNTQKEDQQQQDTQQNDQIQEQNQIQKENESLNEQKIEEQEKQQEK
ncbi:hypothetical protein PPERSA_04726 [Pseudocohnilembus persalinus]|uniref:GDP dissociation inhibitor n=1 Tax=Pseudocohnilembus persalinus TaxID=266149 RepID=A0A0V0R4L1_PSEPJ|nr:hypothetical protein PPERSA_04726 [Pseudocohnilembus persalinus]|eukprot:KRX09420.1 hypothetical protein PPERSA_04726 [Pseudocohnilembus persalinus]